MSSSDLKDLKHIVKGGLKLKKGDLFKKKKKEVDVTKMDITIKKGDQAPKTTKTKAEIAFQKRQEATQFERLQKKAAISHREKVEKFNQQARCMAEMTEFNDIPKVSWTK